MPYAYFITCKLTLGRGIVAFIAPAAGPACLGGFTVRERRSGTVPWP